ncbi:MAG: peptidoglycan DD-metalloendopeptidase family protein [Pseudomonadota bacterium]
MTGGRWAALLLGATVLAACDEADGPGFDFDLRGAAGTVDTSTAVQQSTTERPDPDPNGLITYPNYQVAVARRGDTVTSVAQRIGFPPGELAEFNGLSPTDTLNQNAVLALPRRVSPGGTAAPRDITQIAGAAIDRASGAGQATPVAVQTGQEPIRHRVARGETAFSIARLYGVSPRSLADWNGLGSDLAVREGQYLIIPVTIGEAGAQQITDPGQGTALPPPPSASSALPETVEAEPLPESPNLDQFRTDAGAPAPTPEPVVLQGETSQDAAPSRLRRPVQGSVIREFSARNEGLDFAAAEGTPVVSAADGTVAAITRDTDQVPILVLRHADGLLTVYANIKDIQVAKDDRVSAGQRLASVGPGDPSFLHFEVRRGFEAVDPTPFLR